MECVRSVAEPAVVVPDVQVCGLVAELSTLWQTTPGGFTSFGNRYGVEQQRKTELRVEELMLGDLAAEPKSKEARFVLMQRIKDTVRSFVVRSSKPRHQGTTEYMLNRFSEAGDEFVHQARAFDPELEPEDIFQALRNLWILNSIQAAFSLPVCLTRSGLAYSLLYPYTDNLMDGSSVTELQKGSFNNFLARRLRGLAAPFLSPRAERVSALVAMIESEYPPSHFPGVYESLLAIQRAQEKSLLQQGASHPPGQSAILSISVEKGGMSVVADAYLAKGWLTSAEVKFAFAYGVLLQFLDDLQDVDEDLRNNHWTLFTIAAREGFLDNQVNRLLRLTDKVMVSGDFLSAETPAALTELIARCCRLLVLESVALNVSLFSQPFLEAMEPFSPLRFDAIRSMYEKMRRKQKQLRKTLKIYASSAEHGTTTIKANANLVASDGFGCVT